MSATCEELPALVVARAMGVLERGEAERLDKHLQGCPSCTGLAPAIEESLDDVGPPAREPAPVAAWAAIEGRLDAIEKAGPSPLVQLACTYCHDQLDRDGAVFCAACLAPCHEDCFLEHGRCSAPGCEGTRLVQPNDVVARPRPRRRLRALAFLLTGVTVGAAAAFGGARGPRAWIAARFTDGEARVSLDFRDADLRDVVAHLAKESRQNLLLAPEVKEKVTLTLTDVPWRAAVSALARLTRCDVFDLDGSAVLLEQAPKVTLQFTEANLRVVLQLLAAYSGRNIIISPDVTGDVTLDLKECHWLDALMAITRVCGARVQVKGELVLVSKRSEPIAPGWVDAETAGLRRWSLNGMDGLRPKADTNPPPEAKVTKNEISATNAPARAWFKLLGALAKKNVVVSPFVRGTVSLDLRSVSFEDALDATARSDSSWRMLNRDGVLEIVATGAPPKTAEPPADAEPVLQATVVSHDGAFENAAIVSGQIVEVGTELNDGAPPKTTVKSIAPNKVVVEVEKDGKTTTRTLTPKD